MNCYRKGIAEVSPSLPSVLHGVVKRWGARMSQHARTAARPRAVLSWHVLHTDFLCKIEGRLGLRFLLHFSTWHFKTWLGLAVVTRFPIACCDTPTRALTAQRKIWTGRKCILPPPSTSRCWSSTRSPSSQLKLYPPLMLCSAHAKPPTVSLKDFPAKQESLQLPECLTNLPSALQTALDLYWQKVIDSALAKVETSGTFRLWLT